MKIRVAIVSLLALALLAATPAPRISATKRPGPPPAAARSSPPQGPQTNNVLTNFSGFDTIQVKLVDWNMQSGDYKVPERFTATRQGTELTADSATGNTKKKILHARGHVIVHQTQPLKSGGDVSKVTQEPSTLTCDELDADGVSRVYVATGGVHFTQANREGSSEKAILDDARHMLHMEGNVHLREGEQMVDANVVDYNTQSGEVEVKGSPALIRIPTETPTPGQPKPKPTKKRR